MPDLCGDKQQKKRKKWVVEKVGGPLAHMAHTVPPPVVMIRVRIRIRVRVRVYLNGQFQRNGHDIQ